MSRRALLDGADADAARAAIAMIQTRLATRDVADPSLIHGTAGMAMLFGALGRDGDEAAAERAAALLVHAFEHGAPVVQLAAGLPGAAFAAIELADLVDLGDELLAGIDELVDKALATWSGVYWLWDGAVGLGLHALARGRTDTAARVVAHLARVAERTPDGTGWRNHEDVTLSTSPVDPRGYWNLGAALGACGAINFLAAACEAGVGDAALLADAVEHVLARERDAAPRFPMCDGLGIPPGRERNSWCYGDATIAYSLVRAGEALGRPDWLDRARAIARAMGRIGDGDASLCCGAAGRAHLFHRLAVALDDGELREHAIGYARETIARAGELDRPDLTVGATGIGLVLHAAISPVAPRWDRCLGISWGADG